MLHLLGPCRGQDWQLAAWKPVSLVVVVVVVVVLLLLAAPEGQGAPY
jgi:hypothetical protein